MDFKFTKKQIEEKGFVKLIFEPLNGGPEKFSKKDIIAILHKTVVRVRGWSFPMIPPHNAEDKTFCLPYNVDNAVEFYSNFHDRKEVDRFYTSGQFVCAFALYEDYIGSVNGKDIPEGKFVDFLSMVYKVTEMVYFVKRVIENSDIEGGRLIVSYNNVLDRKLEPIFSPMIFNFHYYSSKMNVVQSEINFSREEILLDHKKLSRKIIMDLFEGFNWNDAQESMIETHQDNLMSGRF